MNEAGGEPKQPFEVVQPVEGAESPKTPAERGQPVPEAAPGKQAMPAALQVPVSLPDVPAATPATPIQDESPSSPVASPKTAKLPAADKDLIEKQWVQKAKEIVAETKSDPHKQKIEIAAAKADYIQKRFKKVIKTDDAVAA
jgi:hypothetical protein